MESPDWLSRERSLADRFRALGDRGLLASLGRAETLPAGCLALSRLAHDAEDLGVFISIIATAGLGVPILERAGMADLAADAIAGRVVIAVAITEREAGSDVMGMRTTLSRAGDGTLRLSGAKWHITNAPVADVVIVFAKDATTDDRFLTPVVVRASDPGVRLGAPLDLIGCAGSPTGEISLEDVVIAEDRVIGKPREGGAILDLAFLRERVLAPWPLIGKMERVIGECVDHVEKREQFGKPLHEFQFVQEKIVASFAKMIDARHLAERAVLAVSRGERPTAIASLAKAAAADAAVDTFRAAIEVFGSYGVQASRRYGEYLQDAICAQIAGGTRETHKKVVFGELRLDRARTRNGRPSRLLRTEGES